MVDILSKRGDPDFFRDPILQYPGLSSTLFGKRKPRNEYPDSPEVLPIGMVKVNVQSRGE
jgi:hypothetical protein